MSLKSDGWSKYKYKKKFQQVAKAAFFIALIDYVSWLVPVIKITIKSMRLAGGCDG